MNTTENFVVPGLGLIQQGKVRDIYDVDGEHMLIVTTDRLSAFDVVLPDPIPGKGEVLTRVTNFWMNRISRLIPNHLTDQPLFEVVSDAEVRKQLGDRAVIVKSLEPLPVEAIVRGYIIGSGWKDYQQTGAVCGITLPSGLQQAEQLPEALFTPSTKASVGDHDENIDFETMVHTIDAWLGSNFLNVEARQLAEQVRGISLKIYTDCAAYARERGIIIADTKFEFGLDENGVLHLIDEVLTPDSSRFWSVEKYRLGISPPSFDKQIVRDYLEELDCWDKTPPGPNLPDEIIRKTADKYHEVERLLTQTSQ